MVNFLDKSKFGNSLLNILAEIFGSFCVAIAFYNFTTATNIPMSGFSGIGLIFNRLFGSPVGLVSLGLNVPVVLLCLRILGWRFVVKSLRCMLIQTFMFDVVAVRIPLYTGDKILAVVCCGVIAGIGFATIYMRGSSTGGIDFITMAVKAYNPHITMGRIILVFDTIVVVIGGLLFENYDGIIYGLIVNAIHSVVLDKVMYGINSGKVAVIITDHGEVVAKNIGEKCDRGSTLIRSIGAYEGNEKWTVICACDTKQMYTVEKVVKEADPGAFIIILESNEVVGEGFHVTRIAEKKE